MTKSFQPFCNMWSNYVNFCCTKLSKLKFFGKHFLAWKLLKWLQEEFTECCSFKLTANRSTIPTSSNFRLAKDLCFFTSKFTARARLKAHDGNVEEKTSISENFRSRKSSIVKCLSNDKDFELTQFAYLMRFSCSSTGQSYFLIPERQKGCMTRQLLTKLGIMWKFSELFLTPCPAKDKLSEPTNKQPPVEWFRTFSRR